MLISVTAAFAVDSGPSPELLRLESAVLLHVEEKNAGKITPEEFLRISNI